MTEQEKRQERAALQIEIENANEDLAYLRAKALRLADGFAEVSRKFRTNGSLNPSGADFDPASEIENRIRPELETLFDFTATVALIDQLRTARKKVFNLSERKAQLSTASPLMTVPID
jgi:hypothetical protein